MRLRSRYWGIAARGLAMGAADVVPGVSGGTIAFISGIYQELLDSISSIGPKTLQTLLQQGPAASWRQMNGNFLLALFAGIVISIFSLAKLISFLLENHPIVVWSFFFGLILASVVSVIRRVPHWFWYCYLFFAVGVAVSLVIGEMRPVTIAATPQALFFSGSLAICAMLLPGISGSFILLMIGIYPQVIAAVHQFNIASLSWFAAGAAIGLLFFSRLLSWLLHRYFSATLAFLGGVLLGSLKIVWPWKLHNEHQLPPLMFNVSPLDFTAQTGEAAQLGVAVLASILALLLVFMMEWFARNH